MSGILTDLIFENMQRHKKLHLQFTAGFNCIFDDNNRGKSTIVRGWKWLRHNDPAGDWMRRISGTEEKPEIYTAKVKAIFEDETVVQRIKGKEVNQYIVSGHDEPFNEVGRDVPSEVSDALGFSSRLKDVDDDIFIRTDEDKGTPIITGKTNTAGKVLNELVGVEEYELAVGEFNRERLALRKESAFIDKEIKTTEDKLSKYIGIKKLEEKLEEIEKLEEDCDVLAKQIAVLTAFDDRREQYIKELDNLKRVDLAKFDNVIEEYEQIIELTIKIDKLVKLDVELEQYSRDYTLLLDTIDKVLVIYKECEDIDMEKTHISTLGCSRDSNINIVNDCNEKLKTIDTKMKKYASEICPTCNGTGRVNGK